MNEAIAQLISITTFCNDYLKPEVFIYIIFILLSYFLGCISTGYYLTLFFTSKDIRSFGSKSTGATNVGRLLGKKGFIFTIIIDSIKGISVAILCKILNFNDYVALLSLIALVCGHIWPFQLRFHGGKGITVLLGFIFIWNIYMLIFFAIIVLIFYLVLKNFTISGLLGLLIFPIFSVLKQADVFQAFLLLLLITIVYLAHIDNIKEYKEKKGDKYEKAKFEN